MIDIAIIIGSTRPGRKGEAVANWIHDNATKRGDATFEMVDLTGFALPPLDEPNGTPRRHPHHPAGPGHRLEHRTEGTARRRTP
ncbi:NADPH-dependent FMN reductase [Nonomuraea sp. LPB2021202275-12-8]|uniref:NADPH-dependent FMN reductase n=1 Tax=Nonomuraea sp. LPB2021202275-12-8 TaxID=3120159 RepID=UPI00300D967B